MAEARPAPPDGVAVVDKPSGWTSHDVVAKARGLLGTRKVGHAGTLDPSATGVLVLGVGRATRLLRYVGDTKQYTGEVVFGTETDTLDADGEVVATHAMAPPVVADLQALADAHLTGAIMQTPPMVSAIQIDGKRLHELARQGIEVERAPRPVTVHRITVSATDDPMVATLDVECSSGTYVRTLAADLGHLAGGGAHLRALRRTAVGPFTLDGAVTLDHLGPEAVRPPADAVAHLAGVVVGPDVARDVSYGKVLPLDVLGVEGDGPWAVSDASGQLLAVYAAHREGTAKPDLVLVPA